MATNVEIHSDVKGLIFLSPDRVRMYKESVHTQFDDANAPPAAVAEIHCHWATTPTSPDGEHKRFWILPNDVVVINRKIIPLA